VGIERQTEIRSHWLKFRQRNLAQSKHRRETSREGYGGGGGFDGAEGKRLKVEGCHIAPFFVDIGRKREGVDEGDVKTQMI
jgi:hypothetical protein